MTPRNGIYVGAVMHKRLRPRAHTFTYRSYILCVDIDALPALDAQLRWLSYNQPGLFSIWDKDHGARDGTPLRPWLEAQAQAAGHALPDGKIFRLAVPRVLGYVFNPLSVYFCFDARGTLRLILYEVKNTFGGQHAYVFAVSGADARVLAPHSSDKRFFVSPFFEVRGHYEFRTRVPDETLSLFIRYADTDGDLLIATQTGDFVPLTDAALVRLFWKIPFVNLKIILGIHFEALRLWLKGIKFVSER